MDATQATEDRIMASILRRLGALSDEVTAAVVKSHTTGQPVPGLSRKVNRLIAAMRWAARLAMLRTPGLETGDVKTALAWRIDKVRALSRIVKVEDKPSLGVLVGMAKQPATFGSELRGKVSDVLVAEHTADQDEDCGPDEVLIWEPERNACVRCLKYAGMYRAAGEQFQAGLSFDPNAPKPKGQLPGPPLHPSCRCNLAVIPKSAAPSNAKALSREAERSVLKGWALESEGDAVRVRAAEALLAGNVIAPKSVIAETRKRLRAGGAFTRDVP